MLLLFFVANTYAYKYVWKYYMSWQSVYKITRLYLLAFFGNVAEFTLLPQRCKVKAIVIQLLLHNALLSSAKYTFCFIQWISIHFPLHSILISNRVLININALNRLVTENFWGKHAHNIVVYYERFLKKLTALPTLLLISWNIFWH